MSMMVIFSVSFVLFIGNLLVIGMVIIEIANSSFYHRSIADFRGYMMKAAGAQHLPTVGDWRSLDGPFEARKFTWHFRLHLMCFLNSVVGTIAVGSFGAFSGGFALTFSMPQIAIGFASIGALTYLQTKYHTILMRRYIAQRGSVGRRKELLLKYTDKVPPVQGQ